VHTEEAIPGTATDTPTARCTTNLTASGHGTPEGMSAIAGWDPRCAAAAEVLAWCDWETSDVQDVVNIATLG